MHVIKLLCTLYSLKQINIYCDDGYCATLQCSAFWQGNAVLDILPPNTHYELLLQVIEKKKQ